MATLTESLSSRAVGEVPPSATMSISQEPSDGRFSSTSADESPGLTTFSLFSLLPAELRLKIWRISFFPRTVVLHTRRTHYADDNHRDQPKWQSRSFNPVALSVSMEARQAALRHYNVALPLYAPTVRHHLLDPEINSERPGDLLPSRSLYLNLEHDTVALLGDLHYTRLTNLLDWLRKTGASPLRNQKGRARGLRRLSMSMAPWAHPVGAATLKAFSRTIFADLDEFILFLYAERVPPAEWKGGKCVLQQASVDTDYYRRFLLSRGKQFVDGDGWMKVGKKPMKVAEIQFVDGW
ncbi:uncharacterized protein QC763_000670 [Podospora pseudopauciseta]|uniref:2EXR domain-containing protein n=1 Tax=Podospora pseudopauciseta TaxID=2093780 RepID=A0ABR0HJR8_9PEZI|nr:hypothetical protein QC763_000670 [Podospora pseudopauciseta]